MALFEDFNLRQRLQGQRDHVHAIDQHAPAARRQGKWRERTVRRAYRQRQQVDLQRSLFCLRQRGDQRIDGRLLQHDGQQTVIERIAIEDFTIAGGDYGGDAELLQAPYGVLAAGTAAEIRAGDQDARRLITGPVQDAVGARLAVAIEAQVVQQTFIESFLADGAQELLGHDLVGIQVVDQQRRCQAGDRDQFFNRLAHCACSSVRTSLMTPVIAAAAAMAGLIRCVRLARPCRPSKLRLVVEAQRSSGDNTSSFMARHIEQPGWRHSKPAAMKMSARPSASAWRRTAPEPGTTMARTLGATLCVPMMAAAARKSSMRLFVQEPMKTRSTGSPMMGSPACSPM